jgi:hypothetical protein
MTYLTLEINTNSLKRILRDNNFCDSELEEMYKMMKESSKRTPLTLDSIIYNLEQHGSESNYVIKSPYISPKQDREIINWGDSFSDDSEISFHSSDSLFIETDDNSRSFILSQSEIDQKILLGNQKKINIFDISNISDLYRLYTSSDITTICEIYELNSSSIIKEYNYLYSFIINLIETVSDNNIYSHYLVLLKFINWILLRFGQNKLYPCKYITEKYECNNIYCRKYHWNDCLSKTCLKSYVLDLVNVYDTLDDSNSDLINNYIEKVYNYLFNNSICKELNNCKTHNCSKVHNIHEQLILYKLWNTEIKENFKKKNDLNEHSLVCLNCTKKSKKLVKMWKGIRE